MSAKRQSKGKANGVSRKKSKIVEDDPPTLSEEEDDDDRRSDDDDVDELAEDNASLVSRKVVKRLSIYAYPGIVVVAEKCVFRSCSAPPSEVPFTCP